MPFTLVAFTESTANYTLDNIAGLADPHVRVSGDDIYVPDELPFLAGAFFCGTQLAQAQILSPTLRRLANLDIQAYDVGAEPGSPPNLYNIFRSPRALVGSEQINAKIITSQSYYAHALVWLSSGPITPVTGEIFTVRCTASTTLTAYAWTNAALTFTQTLPMGRYQVVGMRAKSTGLIAARLVFTGFAWRPGCIGCDAVNDIEQEIFRSGQLGVWGEFAHDAPPTVDFLSVSADTSEEVYLDLIKIA